MEDLPNTLEEIAYTILDIINECQEANESQETDNYESLAMGAIFHWQSAVHHILSLHPDLYPVNNLLSSLTEDEIDYKLHYRDNLLDLYNTCYAYQPFEDILQGEFGATLDSFLEEMRSDVETDDDMRDIVTNNGVESDVETDGGMED
jgi:hypothetical protein